jgi:hypothetical protein
VGRTGWRRDDRGTGWVNDVWADEGTSRAGVRANEGRGGGVQAAPAAAWRVSTGATEETAGASTG